MLDHSTRRSSRKSRSAKIVTATDANREFSAILRRVSRGETIAITSRGRIVARLVPEAEPLDEEKRKAELAAAWEKTLERLKSQPLMHLGKFNRDWAYDD